MKTNSNVWLLFKDVFWLKGALQRSFLIILYGIKNPFCCQRYPLFECRLDRIKLLKENLTRNYIVIPENSCRYHPWNLQGSLPTAVHVSQHSISETFQLHISQHRVRKAMVDVSTYRDHVSKLYPQLFWKHFSWKSVITGSLLLWLIKFATMTYLFS